MIKNNLFKINLKRAVGRYRLLSIVLSCGVLLLVAGASVVIGQRNSTERDYTAAQSPPLLEEKQLATLAQIVEDTVQKTSQQTPPAVSSPTVASQPSRKAAVGPKYSTSSDPRSTAYSTTPPSPKPADVNIIITRPNQVAAGTLISYSTTKNEKAYYGGDLLLSTTNITLSKSKGAVSQPFTVTVPDGVTSTGPSSPWNDRNPYVGIASSTALNAGTSWSMFVHLYNSAPTGTYQVHLQSTRSEQTADAWWYHGFITVTVVE